MRHNQPNRNHEPRRTTEGNNYRGNIRGNNSRRFVGKPQMTESEIKVLKALVGCTENSRGIQQKITIQNDKGILPIEFWDALDILKLSGYILDVKAIPGRSRYFEITQAGREALADR